MRGKRRHGGASLKLRVPSSLPQHMRGPIVELYALESSNRGRGEVEALLREVTLEADMAQTMLFLCVEPGEDTDGDRLMRFYMRHGFMPIQAEPPLMARPYAGMVNG